MVCAPRVQLRSVGPGDGSAHVGPLLLYVGKLKHDLACLAYVVIMNFRLWEDYDSKLNNGQEEERINGEKLQHNANFIGFKIFLLY